MSTSIDQQFVEFIAKSLVSQPDAVIVERRIDERGVLLELTVAPEDLGRVIGKHGATAQSLRTLLRALGTKNDARYNLKIVDSDQPNGGADQPKHDVPQQNDSGSDNVSSSTDDTPSWTSDDTTADDSSEQPDQPASDSSEPSEPAASPDQTTSNVVDKTRKELAELDDLDV